MKKIIIIIFAGLFIFSCSGSPKPVPAVPVKTPAEPERAAVIPEEEQPAEEEMFIAAEEETPADAGTSILLTEEQRPEEPAAAQTPVVSTAPPAPAVEPQDQGRGEAAALNENAPLASIADEENEFDMDITQYISAISEDILNTAPAVEAAAVTPPPAQPPASAQTPPQAQTPAPAQTPSQTQPPAQAQPPAQTPTRPPAQSATQLPAQPQRQIPPVQTPPSLAEETILPREEPPADPPRREVPRPDFPSGAPTRLDSLAQMGMTPLDSEIIYSRIVRATVGQIVEIPFRGTGWVYLGELASRRGIVYNSRRNDPEGLSFIFSLEEAGVYSLKFYRQDFIRDFIINDHVQVIAGDSPSAGAGWFGPPVDRGRVIAQPRWPSAVEEAQIRSGTRIASEPVISGALPSQSAAAAQPSQSTSPSQSTTPSQSTSPSQSPAASQITAPSVQETPGAAQTAAPSQPDISQTDSSGLAPPRERLSPDVLIQRANETFEAGNVPAAIALLDQFMQDYPNGSDEAYWLLGQFYESNSPNRNILLSLEYYNRLVNEYPQSRRFNDARRRIAYLQRYYINIQ